MKAGEAPSAQQLEAEKAREELGANECDSFMFCLSSPVDSPSRVQSHSPQKMLFSSCLSPCGPGAHSSALLGLCTDEGPLSPPRFPPEACVVWVDLT